MQQGSNGSRIERLAPYFETERLVIRLVEVGDLEALLVVNGDDEVTRFLPYPSWRSMEDAHAWYARMVGLHDEGKSRQFVVIDRAEDRIVGAAVIFNVDAGGRAEVGYVLGRRDWSRGLMREAIDALLTHAFDGYAFAGHASDGMVLRRIEAYVDPRNIASHRLLLALGFVHEGSLRERNVVKGEVVDSHVYGLLAREHRRL